MVEQINIAIEQNTIVSVIYLLCTSVDDMRNTCTLFTGKQILLRKKLTLSFHRYLSNDSLVFISFVKVVLYLQILKVFCFYAFTRAPNTLSNYIVYVSFIWDIDI